MLQNRVRFMFAGLALAGLLLPAGLAAQDRSPELRFSIGAWAGTETSEWVGRRHLDYLFAGFTPGVFVQDPGASGTAALPLGLEFFLPAGPGDVMVGLEAFSTATNYTATGIAVSPLAIYDIQHSDFARARLDFSLGYRVPVTAEFSFTPVIGRRGFAASANTSLLGIGLASFASEDEEYQANAAAGYIGVDLEYRFTPEFSGLGGFRYSITKSGGDVSTTSEGFGASTSGTGSYYIGETSAAYEYSFQRIELGLGYYPTANVRLALGFRGETVQTRYPDYLEYGLGVSTAGGTVSPLLLFSLDEFITDRFFVFDREESEEFSGIFFEFTYILDL